MQALASGIPVIGGDSDGSRNPLRDGVDGRLVMETDIAVLASAIITQLRTVGQESVCDGVFCRAQFVQMVKGLAEWLPSFAIKSS